MALVKKEIEIFSSVYSDYFPLVYSTVYSKVGNVDDAQDISQEVFIRFYEKLASIENYRKWLYGTLRNVLFEHFRKKDTHIDIDEAFQDISMSFVNGFHDTRLIIEDAINNIKNFENEKDHLLFDLVAIRKMSYAKTAKELGMKAHQVKYRYRKIVDRIIDYLKKKGIASLEELL